MPFWYFLKIPPLPAEVAHQSNDVQICRYLVRENGRIDEGAPIALIENYWAVMRLCSVGKGTVRKKFFERQEYVLIGTPIAIIATDGEDLVKSKENMTVEIVEIKRTRPHKRQPAKRDAPEGVKVLHQPSE